MTWRESGDNPDEEQARRHLRLLRRLAAGHRWRRMLDSPRPPYLLPLAREFLLDAAVRIGDQSEVRRVIWEALAADMPQQHYLRLARLLIAAGRMEDAGIVNLLITAPDLRAKFNALKERAELKNKEPLVPREEA